MKKLIVAVLFLIPIYISSFKKTTFLFPTKSQNIIVYLKDKELYLDLDDYIFGVVSAEMPALFEEEALKAQAVAARSYTLSSLNDTRVIEITTLEQAYKNNYELKDKWLENYDNYYKKINNIVTTTTNEIIKRDNKILKTYYFAMSNGKTENSKTVFNESTFTSVISPEDENNKNYKVETIFTEEELKEKLNIETIKIDNIERNDTNHISKITISGKEYTGIELRKILKLRSTSFTIEKIANEYKITTLGYGHGVGMSQYGANKMAKDGKNYKEILDHYYQDTKITKI